MFLFLIASTRGRIEQKWDYIGWVNFSMKRLLMTPGDYGEESTYNWSIDPT